MTVTSKLVTVQLKLKLNERLRKIMHGRVEYGYKDDLCVIFEIKNPLGGFRAVTEEDFVQQKRLTRNVGIFGEADPIPALQLLMKTYPDAMIMVRKDPAKRRRRS